VPKFFSGLRRNIYINLHSKTLHLTFKERNGHETSVLVEIFKFLLQEMQDELCRLRKAPISSGYCDTELSSTLPLELAIVPVFTSL